MNGSDDYIEIFIASSIDEFKEEREAIENLFTILNNQSIKKGGVKFVVERCENLSTKMNASEKQSEYNAIIRDSRCKYFYMLIGNKLGEYTKEEFNVAWERFRKEQNPLIYPFLIKGKGGEPDQNVTEFVEYLQTKLSHFTNEYSNVDSIKTAILLDLIANGDVAGVATIEGGMARLDGQDIFSVQEVPGYKKNEELQEKKSRFRELTIQYAELKKRFKDEDDDSVEDEYNRVIREREILKEEIHQMESAIGEMLLFYRKADGADWRENKAHDYIKAGEYAEAEYLLKDKEWERELEDENETLVSYLEKCGSYINGKRMLITILRSKGLTEKKIQEIKKIYETASNISIQWHIIPELLYEYASFLHAQFCFDEGLDVAEKLECLYKLYGCENSQDQGALCHLIGKLHYGNKNYPDTWKYYEMAMAHYRSNGTDYSKDIKQIMKLYVDLSEVSQREGDNDRSIQYLKLGEELFQNEGAEIEKDNELQAIAASIYGNLGFNYRHKENYKAAIENHEKAIAVRKELCAVDFEKYGGSYAISCNDFAFVYKEISEFSKAVRLYEDGVEVREKLYINNPEKNASSLGNICMNLAKVYMMLGEYEKAGALQEKSLNLRKKLMERGKAFRQNYANACRNYANYLALLKQYEDAENMYQEALNLWEELYSENPDAYGVWLAMEYRDSAWGMLLAGKFKESEEFFIKSRDLYEQLLGQGKRQRDRQYLMMVVGLTEILEKNGRKEEAEQMIRRELSEYQRISTDEYHYRLYAHGIAALSMTLAKIKLSGKEYIEAAKILTEAKEAFEPFAQSCPEVYGQALDYMKYLSVLAEEKEGDEKAAETERRFCEKYGIEVNSYVNCLFI